MTPETIFRLHLVFGYVAWLLCFRTYLLPRLRAIDRFQAHRAIATLHSFRFFGLVFLLPGVVGPHLPTSFAVFSAYGDLATAVFAMLALLTTRIRPLFWLFVVSFNLTGIADLLIDYIHAMQTNLPANPGQLASTYWIPILYVPLLMITHLLALTWLVRPAQTSSTLNHAAA